MSLAKQIQIGSTQAGLAPLSSIETGVYELIPDPLPQYFPERTRIKVTSRKTIGRGAAYIIWHWDFLRAAHRHALRTVITALCVDGLYIESPKNDHDQDPGAGPGDDQWAQFKVIAVWPAGNENKVAGRRLGFDIEFEIEEELEPIEEE